MSWSRQGLEFKGRLLTLYEITGLQQCNPLRIRQRHGVFQVQVTLCGQIKFLIKVLNDTFQPESATFEH
jgi:hypothetical protein